MNLKRKMLSILPAFTIMLAILLLTPITAKAEVTGGDCGEDGSNLKWVYDSDSATLTISGIGEMYNYSESSQVPWHDYCTKIESVVIGDNVTSVGDYAFIACTALTSVTIGNSVTSIGDDAFDRCENLTSVTIPNSVTSIGNYAFFFCTALTSVTIPGSVKDICNYAFYGCKSLANVTIESGVESIWYAAFAGIRASSIAIPPTVTSIGKYAFGYSQVFSNQVCIISGVENSKAQEYATENGITFKPVTLVDIPSGQDFNYDGKEHIGVSLEPQYSVSTNYKATNPGTYTVNVSLRENCRWSDWTITDKTVTWKIILVADISSATITLPDQTYTYNGSAFTPEPTVKYNGATLTKDTDYTVSYKDNTNAGTATIIIEGKGNYGGTKETTFVIDPVPISSATVTLPDQTYTYNGSAFTPEPTVKIENDTLVKDKDYTVSYSNNTNAGTATVTITGKGNYTGTKVTTFVINPAPDTTKTDDSTNTSNNGTDNQTPSTSAAEVKTGDTVKDDKTNASYVITSTKTNNETVTYVSTTNNTASTLTVPDTVTISGKKYKVTEIKANAFKNNKKLKKITIGKNIKKIGKNAFSGCKNLKNVNIKTTKLTKKTVGANAFKGINAKAKVKVPKSKLKAYKTILKARGIKGKKQKITK